MTLEQRRLARELGIDPRNLHINGVFGGPELPEVFDELRHSCCMNAALDGFRSCTCWEPVYDLDQAAPNLGELERVAADLRTSLPTASQLIVYARERCCGECAYRNGSPERARGYLEELRDIAGDGSRFFCHEGMRRVVGWTHPTLDQEIRAFFPTGIIPAGPGDYRPPILHGIAFRADGTPAELCAGWNAHRNALIGAQL